MSPVSFFGTGNVTKFFVEYTKLYTLDSASVLSFFVLVVFA